MQDSFRFQYMLLAHSEAQFYSMRLRSLALTVYTGARCFLKYKIYKGNPSSILLPTNCIVNRATRYREGGASNFLQANHAPIFFLRAPTP